MSTKRGVKRKEPEEKKTPETRSKPEPETKKARAETEAPSDAKRKMGSFWVLKGDISKPTVDISDPDGFISRLFIQKVNSKKSNRWKLFVWAQKEDGSLSEDTLEEIRFSVPIHRINMVPKRFKSDNKAPYAFSLPLPNVDKADSWDAKMEFFFNTFRRAVAATLEGEGVLPEGYSSESFDDPKFYKGPVSSWSGGTDFKTRFEFHPGNGKPTYILADVTTDTGKPRIMSPEYLKQNEGIEAVCGLSNIYMMEVEDEEALQAPPGNQEGMGDASYTKVIVGSTSHVIMAKRYNVSKTNELLGDEAEDSESNPVYEMQEKNKWSKLSFFQV